MSPQAEPYTVAVLTRSFAKASRRPIEYLEAHGLRVVLRPNDAPGDEARVAECIGDAEAAIVSAQDRIGEMVFARCPKLKVIADHAVGCDRIDLEGAQRRGIAVSTCPGNHESVAELTWLLILAAARRLCDATAAVRAGQWQPSAFVGVEVLGKTLGIVGYGRIGRAVARRAVGFQNQVLVYDPYVAQAKSSPALHIEQVALEELLARADIITLHMPLTDETTHMIDRRAFALMRDGVILINTARGELIDEDALYDALQSGKVRLAGLDTFAQEPPTGNRLLALPNVIPTPHMGAQTHDANLRMGMLAAEFIVKALRSE